MCGADLVALAVLLASVLVGGLLGWHRWLRLAVFTLPRDLRAGYRYLKLQLFYKKCVFFNSSVPKLFDWWTRKHPKKACFIFHDEQWSFEKVDEYSNQVANLFISRGFRKGDVVGLFMGNRPEFVCMWLGLAKIGVVSALINSQLWKGSLEHCIKVAGCQALIFGFELASAVQHIKDKLGAGFPFFVSGEGPCDVDAVSIDKEMAFASKEKPNVELSLKQELLYIFTSGTTGMPKAAVLSHSRFIMIVGAIYNMQLLKEDDVIYDPLPLYHTAGGCLGAGQALINGCTVVLRKKFSVSNYWEDCRRHGCTVAQYIGEMCRYLLMAPEQERDRNHRIRLMLGNGIRPRIWEHFQKRFGIERIGEFYGATEGIANLTNIDNRVGSIGFVSRLFPSVYPVTLIRIDYVTGLPIRGPNGLCVKCKPREPGELVGKISSKDAFREFQGYSDRSATEKKIIRDAFEPGDRIFLSGDLLVMDELGYLYFKDRRGDTFRWRGENVATAEVESLVSEILNLSDCVAYGVKVPGVEGRAGMVAITNANSSRDLRRLIDGLHKELPPYARPIFYRIVKQVDKTETFKFKKMQLREEGFDPAKIEDEVFYVNPQGQYELVTPELYVRFLEGKMSM